MAVLVTGGAGYIGSHVARELVKAGFTTIILDDLSKGHAEAVSRIPGARLVVGDAGDTGLLRRLLAGEMPRGAGGSSGRKGVTGEPGEPIEPIEAVIHLAADSLVGESVADPHRYYCRNVAKSLALAGAMLEAGVKYLVFSSTAAVYGEPGEIPIPESHPCAPTNPYGESKLFFEQMLARYEEAYGLRYISLRYFNAAGADAAGDLGEDHRPETHLVPLVLQAALGQRPAVEVYGADYPTPDGTCIRDYIHVTDLAVAHVLALKALVSGGPGGIYNLGNQRGYSVLEVIECARRLTGCPIEVVEGPRRPGDPAVLVASSGKISSELGWRPLYPDLQAIVATAWQWHRFNPDGFAAAGDGREKTGEFTGE